MTAEQGALRHHTSAAAHHGHAAEFHTAASRHYQIGKDYAHAAHQALVAHGHAMLALEHGQEARDCYAGSAGGPLPGCVERAKIRSPETSLTSPPSLSEAERHTAAAWHHVEASRHHAKASTHCDAIHYVRAADETEAALGHARHALHHGNGAAMRHAERDISPSAKPASNGAMDTMNSIPDASHGAAFAFAAAPGLAGQASPPP
jgi:hypothetical protein